MSAKDGNEPLTTQLPFKMVIRTLLYYFKFHHFFILSLFRCSNVGNDGDSLTGKQAIESSELKSQLGISIGG